jgi:hypothetical protein
MIEPAVSATAKDPCFLNSGKYLHQKDVEFRKSFEI